MSFLCRVSNSPEVMEAIARLRLADRAVMRHCVCRDGHFHTVAHELFLHELCAAMKPSKPLRHRLDDIAVTWVARTKEARAHVRDPIGLKVSGRPHDANRHAHEWTQAQLVDLGRRLGQSPKIEFELPGPTFCDVVWPEARIAWEVDLTLKSAAEQTRRVRVRADAGLRMIALMNGKTRNTSHIEHPRVLLHGLAEQAHDQRRPWDFSACYVNNVNQGSLRFDEFCQALLNGEVEYRGIGRPRSARKGRYRWERLPARQIPCLLEAQAPAVSPLELRSVTTVVAAPDSSVTVRTELRPASPSRAATPLVIASVVLIAAAALVSIWLLGTR